MIEDKDDIEICFFFGEIKLKMSDFTEDIRGLIAYEIALTAATTCIDKSAALELIHNKADQILIKLTRTGRTRLRRPCRHNKADQILIKLTGPSECIECGCNDNQGCDLADGETCFWIRLDRQRQVGVCSHCPTFRWDAGARAPNTGLSKQERKARRR